MVARIRSTRIADNVTTMGFNIFMSDVFMACLYRYFMQN